MGKFSETNADPHNAKRGFFFAHVGWLLCKKHPEVKRRGVTVDVSDLLADPIVRFQRRVYLPLILLLCFALPAIVPWYFWGESLKTAFFCASIFRYILTLNVTWLVNSAAHIWGPHPYDKNISPAENIAVAMLTWGEGFHNYHHTFPWDYKPAELHHRHVQLLRPGLRLENGARADDPRPHAANWRRIASIQFRRQQFRPGIFRTGSVGFDEQ